jgi:hypothetical protein
MSKAVFISHRHADEKIASVLNDHLQRWQLGKDLIFQSSNAQGGPGLGGNLNQELLKALREARLLLLVYTIADGDWSYCMWECGVATNKETPTRISIFRLTDDVPQVFRDLVSVSAQSRTDIESFVHRFFRERGWVRDGSFNDEPSERILNDYAENLYLDLQKHSPKPQPKPEVRRRWDMLTLRFDASIAQEILKSDEIHGKPSTQTIRLVQENGKVVKDFGEALKHFGWDSRVRDLTLAHLVQRWCKKRDAENACAMDWVDELCAELIRALAKRPAEPACALMLGPRDSWFYPVVASQRIESDGTVEFDIHMYRLARSLLIGADSFRKKSRVARSPEKSASRFGGAHPR